MTPTILQKDLEEPPKVGVRELNEPVPHNLQAGQAFKNLLP